MYVFAMYLLAFLILIHQKMIPGVFFKEEKKGPCQATATTTRRALKHLICYLMAMNINAID